LNLAVISGASAPIGCTIGAAVCHDRAVQFIAGAFMAVLSWWLDQGATLPPAEVDVLLRRLVMRGLKGN
jgi:hypothetical protein